MTTEKEKVEEKKKAHEAAVAAGTATATLEDKMKMAAADAAKGWGGEASSLSEMEWKAMERNLENETKSTHINLQRWLYDRAAQHSIFDLLKWGCNVNTTVCPTSI